MASSYASNAIIPYQRKNGKWMDMKNLCLFRGRQLKKRKATGSFLHSVSFLREKWRSKEKGYPFLR